MTVPQTVPERTTKRADELAPGDLLDDNFYDGVQVVLSAHRFVDCGEQGVYAVIRDEDGGVYSREFDPAFELPVQSAPQPTGYQAVAAELRRIAAGLDTLPPTRHKPFTQVHVLPVEKTAEAVDAIGLAVLGMPGVTEESGQGFRRRVKNGFEGVVRFSSFVEVPNPANGRDAELEKLRARIAELEAQKAVPEPEPVRELLAIAPAADGGVAFALAPAGAVTDPVARAKVVELTEAVAADPPGEHRFVSGSIGGVGEFSAGCACGTTYSGFDSMDQATAELDRHIADPTGLTYSREADRPGLIVGDTADEQRDAAYAAYDQDDEPAHKRLCSADSGDDCICDAV